MDTKSFRRAVLGGFVLAGLLPLVAQEPSGKSYEDLRPEQRRLVVDWFGRLAAVTGKPIDPREGYNNTALSTRTTFDAVTHALLQTTLTDADGKKLGTAFDMILRVNEVMGRILDARSDEQFRLYVELAPDAYRILTKSREFRRTADNTTFHRGYPISFRGNSGTPSIQFSMTRDHKYGDIDVDYRSSRFPTGLVNGHLTASNSDIRAGNNDERHNTQWSGMSNWWRNLFGLPILGRQDGEAQTRAFPASGRVSSRAPIEAAVSDFLKAWLVEKKVDAAVGYIDRSAYSCIDPTRGAEIDRGMARYRIFLGMVKVSERVGNVTGIEEATEGMRFQDPRLRLVRQPSPAFNLYDTREDLGEMAQCDKRARPETASLAKLDSQKFGNYYIAAFRIKTPEGDGQGVATLWTRDGGAWRLIAFEAHDDLSGFKAPRLTPSSIGKTDPLPESPGDPRMLRAALDFFERWLVRKDLDATMNRIDPACLPCVGLDRDAERPTTPDAQRALLRSGLQELATAAGRVRRLNEAIEGVIPFHEHMKLVRHPNSAQFTVVEIPDYLQSAAECAKRKPGDLAFVEPPANVTFGGHFATVFQMKVAGKQGEIFWLLWDNTPQGWKVVSYTIQTP